MCIKVVFIINIYIPMIINTLKSLITDVILPISPIIMLFIVYDIMDNKKDKRDKKL